MDASDSTIAETPRTREEVRDWGQRIRNIQRERVSPEVLNRIQNMALRRNRAQEACRDARILERTNLLSSATHVTTFLEMSRNQTPEYYQSSSATHSRRAASVRDNIQQFRDVRLTSSSRSGRQESERQAIEDSLSAVELEIQRSAPSTVFSTFPNTNAETSPFEPTITATLDTLLDSLKIEPTDETELSAKFMIFENILGTVSDIREETIAFWEANKDQFSGASYASCNKEIQSIDNSDAMGLTEYESRGREWFVYFMTKKANKNSAMIAQVLAKLRSRLEILAQELGECPCCLDNLTAEACTTLGCCHRVCNDCWQHWKQLKEAAGATPFCPLCKHEEFIEEIINNF